MKKYLLIMFAAILTIGLPMQAQNRQGRQDRLDNNRGQQTMRMTAKERVEWMAKEIELTDVQKTEVEALLQKQDEKRAEDMAKMREQRNKSTSAREEMRSIREKEMKQNQAELEKIIGKEKSDKLNALRQSRINSNRQGRRK